MIIDQLFIDGDIEGALSALRVKEKSGTPLSELDYYHIALCESKLGNDDIAIVYYGLSISKNYEYENAYNNLANIYLRKHQYRLATAVIARLCEINLVHVEKYFSVLFNQQNYTRIRKFYFKNRNDIELTEKIIFLIAFSCAESGCLEEAAELASQLADSDAKLKLLGRISYLKGNAEDALNFLSNMDETDGDAYLTMATIHLSLRNKKTALNYFKETLNFANSGEIGLYNLSRMLMQGDEVEYYVNWAKNRLSANNLSEQSNIALYFALFHLHDVKGDFPTAAHYLKLANKLTSGRLTYSNERQRVIIKNIITKENDNHKYEARTLPKSVLHVFGLPRSGTSLLEKLISDRLCATPCGELNVVARSILNNLAAVHRDGSTNVSNIHHCYQGYFEKSDDPMIIDKQPFNFMYFGECCRNFENYKAINIYKNKKEAAWSLYKQWFGSEVIDWNYKWEDIASYMKLYNELIKFWHEKYPNQILDVSYENLVNDPEFELIRIKKFLGLNCRLEEGGNKNFMQQTASNSQLIDGITNKYLGQHAAYLEFFPELEQFGAANF